MKKIFLIILLVGFGLWGIAQDKDLITEDFSTVPPSDWTKLDDQGGSGTSVNWAKSCYPMVNPDVVSQEEWLISPTISLNAANTYQIRFNYYQLYTTYGTNDLTLYVSYDNGVTWDETQAEADIVWQKSVDGGSANNNWYNTGYFAVAAPAVTGGAKFAFVYEADIAGNGDVMQAIDNVLLQEDNGGGMVDYRTYGFENGIIASTWTVLSNQAGTGSTETWSNKFFAKVGEDNTLVQEEWLLTPKIEVSNAALTDLIATYSFYNLLNTAGQGCILYVASETDWNTFNVVDNYHSANNLGTSVYNRSITLNPGGLGFSIGDSLQFAFVFQTTVAGNVDFYLQQFTFETRFNEGSVQGDADLTLGALDVVMYPLFDKYNDDFKEGFWTVGPDGWDQTSTSDANWERVATVWGSPVLSHDYAAFIDTVGADMVDLDETLTSEVISINYPSVGASYELSFEWRTNTHLNAGQNTDPNLGVGVDYDFADITVELRTNGGTWTQIWQEDDEAILEATTVTSSTNYYYAWPGFANYVANENRWYKAILDISQYISASTTDVEVRFNYTGDAAEGGDFYLDNFYVLQTQNPDFEMEAMIPFTVSDDYHIDYYRIPIKQITNPVQMEAKILNYGIASFDSEQMYGTVNGNTVGYDSVKSSAWTGSYPSTERFEVGHRAVEYLDGVELQVNTGYTFGFSTTLDGTALSDSKYFIVDDDMFSRSDGSFDGYVSVNDNTSGAVGSVFEFKNEEVINQIRIYTGTYNSGSKIYMSVIKLADPNATSGITVRTTPSQLIVNGYNNFNDDFTLQPGFYAFMFHQTDQNNLTLAYNSNFEGEILRGNVNNLYTDDSENFNLWMDIYVYPNNEPVIPTNFLTGNKVTVVAGKSVSIDIIASDVDEDALTWPEERRDTTPAWLASWMVFTAHGDTMTITGTPDMTDLGTSHVTLWVEDPFGGDDDYEFDVVVISTLGTLVPDYSEAFSSGIPFNWTTFDDQLNMTTTQHWSTWNNYLSIYGENNNAKQQDEWVLSAPFYLEDITNYNYRLEFDWIPYRYDYFCGGNKDVLGSAGNGGYNYADVTLLVSTDNGLSWSEPIWKEDEPELVAPVTEGIEGGVNWEPYKDVSNNGYDFHTSKIDLGAYKGDTVLFAFRYQGKNAINSSNNFYIDNFKVLMNDQYKVSVITDRDYYYVTERQIDQINGMDFRYTIINQGREIPSGSTYTLTLSETGYSETFPLTEALFASSDTLEGTYTFYPQANINQWYNFTTQVNVTGNTATGNGSSTADNYRHQENVYIQTQQMQFETSNSVQEMSLGYYDGLGVGYEIINADHLERIYANFGSNQLSTTVSVSIIKVNNWGDTSGELIATVDDSGGSPLTISAGGYNFFVYNDKDINADLYLVPGKYIFMFNQLDANKPLYIYRTDNHYDKNNYYRGNFSNIYTDDYDKGNLNTYLYFDYNDVPQFADANGTIITSLTVETLAGTGKTFEIYAKDNDGLDILGFKQVTEPAFMAPSWLSFTYSEDTAFMAIANTVAAGEYPAQLMLGDGVDTTTLDITINVKGVQSMSDEFYEPFNNWTENYPKVVTNDNTWMLAKGDNSESTNDWYRSGSYSRINTDNSNYQNEWLISPYVYFNTPSNDTTYWLYFTWYINDVSKMLGGIPGEIGSGDEFIDYNYADLRLKYSTNGGATWTLLWQEDDEASVKTYTDGITYPYSNNTFYIAEIDITSLAGEPLLFGFQYEGMGGSYVYLDEIEVQRVDPYVDLDIVNYDVLPYYIPAKQAASMDIKFSVKNSGTQTSKTATIAAQVTNSGGDLNPAYEETLPMTAIPGGKTVEFPFPAATAEYGQLNWNYNFYFDIYQPYNISKSYSAVLTDEYYSFDHNTVNGYENSDMGGQGLGQVFQIFEEDLLTRIYMSNNGNNYYVVNIVSLDSASATSGTLMYTSSPIYKSSGYGYLDFEDVNLVAGYYAVFINDSESNQTFNIGYDAESGDNPGTYVKGNATSFEVVEMDRYLYLRLYFDNNAPYFANAAGNSISLTDGVANVGIEYSKTIRAIDSDTDDVPEIIGLTLPDWVTIVNSGEGFVTVAGIPTAADLGDNLVVLRAIDGTTYDQDDFNISVSENPAPNFTTTPITVAYEGMEYSYTAMATDMFGDAVELAVTKPAGWNIDVAGEGTNTVTISGNPGSAEVGEHEVVIIATDVPNGMTSEQRFVINVIGNVISNEAPYFTSTPVITANVGVEYSYNVVALDGDANDYVAITITSGPSWLAITQNASGTATLSGTPTSSGSASVSLTATDEMGARATQTFTIFIFTETNAAPVFTVGNQTATEDILFSLKLEATDADDDYLYFIADVLPNWMTLTVIGNGEAVLQGVPTQAYAGVNQVSISVGDGVNKVTRNFTITVAEVNDPPVFNSIPANEVTVIESYIYKVEAWDEENAELLFNATLPEWLTMETSFDGTAIISGTPTEDQIGTSNVVVSVSDGNSTVEQEFELKVIGVVDIDQLNENELSLYPNPTNGEFRLSNAEGARVLVYSSTGEVVKIIENATILETINLSNYANGAYIVKVISTDKVITKSINLIK